MAADSSNPQTVENTKLKVNLDSTNKFIDSVLSNGSLRSMNNSANVQSQVQEEKCHRCDRAIRKFEDSIRCSSEPEKCARVYHRRCVLPQSATGDLNDDRWSCENCYIVRPVENVVVKERHRNQYDDYEYRIKDSHAHICKNANCPQVRSYSKVKSASSINDYVIDSGSVSRSHVYLHQRPIEEKVVVTDLESPRFYRHQPKYETEYVVREEVPTYKTYSYVEPQVNLIPAHVERVEITEIAQGIDDRKRYKEPVFEKIVEKIVEVRRPEPVVEKVVEVRRPEPVVEVRRPAEVYTYAVVDDAHVVDDHQYFYYATDEDRRVETHVHKNCKHECSVHPGYYKYEKSPKTHKSIVSYDIPLTVQVPTTKKIISTKQINADGDLVKMRLMERQITDQASQLKSQDDRIGQLTTYLRRFDSEAPVKNPLEKRCSALNTLIYGLKGGKRYLDDRPKSTVVSLTKPTPPSTIEIPKIKNLNYADIQNGYDSLTSNKKGASNFTRSEVNLRFDDHHLGDGKNTVSSRISDKYFTDSYRTGSLERSSSALATVYDGNRGNRDGIYEYVRPIAPNAVVKASYRGYLERIRFDKILFITEKLYCVIDGSLMHVYKKPTDKRQSKSYKLTGVKVKTSEDFQREQQLSLGTKKINHVLKHPRSFEVLWKNGKSYQFVVPKDGDFHLWINALRGASAIDQHLCFDPKGL